MRNRTILGIVCIFLSLLITVLVFAGKSQLPVVMPSVELTACAVKITLSPSDKAISER